MVVASLDKLYRMTDKKVKAVISRIRTRNHHIGFHPSYNLYNDSNGFTGCFATSRLFYRKRFSKIGGNIICRFGVSDTWAIWGKNNMEWDSTVGYAETFGFRCGTCFPFTVFDISNRKHLRLVERPLTLMEVSGIQYMKLKPDEMLAQACELLDQVKKYSGEFVLLWHNSNLNTKNEGI